MLRSRSGLMACLAARSTNTVGRQLSPTAAVMLRRTEPLSLQKRRLRYRGMESSILAESARFLSTTPKPMKWTMYEADPSMYLDQSSECKLIHFVRSKLTAVGDRHAEGIHNAAARDRPDEFWDSLFNSQEMWDAPLNQAGKQQCEVLMETIVRSGINVDLVFVSPLTRTLQTAALSFGVACPKAPMLASEDCRERIAVYTSEGRATTSELRRDWPEVDFSELAGERDTMFAKKEEDDAVGARALQFLDRVMACPHPSVAVVSHSVFLQQLYRQFEATLPAEFHAKRQDFATLRTVAVCPAKP